MLAEHDRCGPALAATTATFPLNDVDICEPARSLMDLHEQQNLIFRIDTQARLPPSRPRRAASGFKLVEPVGIEPTT